MSTTTARTTTLGTDTPAGLLAGHPARRMLRAVTVVTVVTAVAITLIAGLLGSSAQAASFAAVKPGMEGKRVVMVQKRLVDAGMLLRAPNGVYDKRTTATVKRFQAKFGIKQTGVVGEITWGKLTSLTRDGNGVDDRCLHRARAICVDKTQKVMRLVKNGRVVQVLDARFGAKGMETREGTFSVQRKSRDHVSSIYGSAMPFALFFSGGQAVHYSADFAKKGYNGGSHGCVNLRNKRGAQRLFDAVRTGDRVVVYRS